MDLFLDTSSDKVIFALIDNKKVVAFEKNDSNKKAVKNTNLLLDLFLDKNKINYFDFKKIYFTSGPGSFTGLRVALLIVKTIKMLNNEVEILTLDSLSVQKDTKLNINPVIKISQTNYYYFKKSFFRNKIVFSKKEPVLENISINFDSFDAKVLEDNLNLFKIIDLDNFELNYVNTLY